MSIVEKIKGIKNKIEQTKAQHNLDRQTAKISALPSENVSKYEFLTGKDVLLEKGLLEKAAAIKRFKYSPLGKELKAQIRAVEKKCQKLDKVFESNEQKFFLKKSRAKSNLVYSKDLTFYRYRNTKKFAKCSSNLKRNDLIEFKDI